MNMLQKMMDKSTLHANFHANWLSNSDVKKRRTDISHNICISCYSSNGHLSTSSTNK